MRDPNSLGMNIKAEYDQKVDFLMEKIGLTDRSKKTEAPPSKFACEKTYCPYDLCNTNSSEDDYLSNMDEGNNLKIKNFKTHNDKKMVPDYDFPTMNFFIPQDEFCLGGIVNNGEDLSSAMTNTIKRGYGGSNRIGKLADPENIMIKVDSTGTLGFKQGVIPSTSEIDDKVSHSKSINRSEKKNPIEGRGPIKVPAKLPSSKNLLKYNNPSDEKIPETVIGFFDNRFYQFIHKLFFLHKNG